jgi:glutamyl-tRNA synthetase
MPNRSPLPSDEPESAIRARERTCVRGRFAPTPSGRMHLGNVWCALAAWLAVRSEGGVLVLRIEDLDRRVVPPGAEEAMLDDLRWLGLDWDEGPYRQSERAKLYAQAAQDLVDAGLTYPCFCSRADLHAADAPHASDGTPIYPGTCRDLSPKEVARRMRAAQEGRGHKPALRLRVPDESDRAGTIAFSDRVYGARTECLARDCGDFVIRRSDGIYAYQLAVTVDDALMGITQIVRGRDLLGSCARQIYLQRLLGYPRPSYAHLPMLMAQDGTRRLSKRDHDADLGFMRDHFGRPEVLIGRLAHLVGLRPTNEPTTAAELLDGFSWEAIRRAAGLHKDDGSTIAGAVPHDIPVPGSFFMV